MRRYRFARGNDSRKSTTHATAFATAVIDALEERIDPRTGYWKNSVLDVVAWQ